MITCPYCQAALREDDPACPQCGMDANQLAGMMGPMPIIPGGASQDDRHFERTFAKAGGDDRGVWRGVASSAVGPC